MSNIFITTNNRELGSQFNSLQSKLHELFVVHVANSSIAACNVYSILS